MRLSPLLPLLVVLTGCAGLKQRIPAENSPQEEWARVYGEGAAGTQPEADAGAPGPGVESPHPGFVRDPATNAYVWTPGTKHSLRANQTAGQVEGTWIPDPGYAASPQGSTQVEWQPGLWHPTRAHVRAGIQAGRWVADRGYVLDDDGRARWAPGRPDPADPDLVSGVGEGTWVARPEGERDEAAASSPDRSDGANETGPALESERSWAPVDGPLGTAARVQTQIDEERRARGVSRAGVLTELTEQLDRAMDVAVAAAFPDESSAAHREVRAVALSGLESGFEGWGALGTDRSAAASTAVRSRCPAVVDVDVAAEFFVRLRRAAERMRASEPATVE